MSGKPTTPISSPKMPKAVKLNPPSTPPSKTRSKRLSGTYLNTPDQNSESTAVPFSPSIKRSSSGSFKSPDYKLNSHNHNSAPSPYNSNLLKTPRHTGYDSDDDDSGRNKAQKTPQYFSPGKKLFTDEGGSPKKEELLEISSQLKTRLSSALGKLQQNHQSTPNSNHNSIQFTDLSFTSVNQSPTKKLKASISTPKNLGSSVNGDGKWSPSLSVQKANLNLQTLQQSPLPKSSPTFTQYAKFDGARQALFQDATITPNSQLNPEVGSLKQSPILTDTRNDTHNNDSERISMPSPDEESSAQNALLAALSRKQRRKSHSQPQSRPLSTSPRKSQTLHEPAIVLPAGKQPVVPQTPPMSTYHSQHQSHQPQYPHHPVKLPSLNIALKARSGEASPGRNINDGANEQDAVLSLMSLSSPQSIKFKHSRNNSNDVSPQSQFSNNSALTSPQHASSTGTTTTTLPPISGLLQGSLRNSSNRNSQTVVTPTTTISTTNSTPTRSVLASPNKKVGRITTSATNEDNDATDIEEDEDEDDHDRTL